MKPMLVEWVLTSALLILAVIALRALLGRRISAGLRYALWAVVLVRLLVPLQFFSLPVPVNLPEADREPITASAAPAATFPAIQGEPVGAPVITAPHPGGVAANYDVTDTPSTAIPDVTHLWDVLNWLWLAGAMVMAAAFLFSNLTFALRLRRVRVPLEDADCPLPVYLAENLPSPCLFGLVRPSVYVTAESAQNPAMLRHILAHEYTHFRHGDYVWNLLRSAALAIHWWNPLVWLAIILNRRDCELACDEGTLKQLGDDERFAYGRTLLALITVKPGPGDLFRCATTMTGGQKSVFDRVTRIARAPKRWLWAAVMAVIATALACVCAFGQVADTDPADTPDLTSDLTFSWDEEGILVRIEGSVDGIEMDRTRWFTPSWIGLYDDLWPALGLLEFEMPLCGGEVVCSLDARWTDESRSAVRATATPRARISSYFPTGNLIFTVDLSEGTLLELDGYIPKLSADDPELVPTETEAVRTARVAAKLLTEAENYYQSHSEDLSPQPVSEPPISIDEVPAIDPGSYALTLDDYGIYVNITGLDCEYASWSSKPESAFSDAPEHALGVLSLDSPRFLGERFSQRYPYWSALYSPEDDPDLVWIAAYDGAALIAVNKSSEVLCCTVDLSTGEIVNRDIAVPSWENAGCELSNDEMVRAARMLAQLIRDASDFYQASLPAPEDGPLPFDVPMKMKFASGAGGWDTLITLHPDGSFEGDFHDMDMGDTGPGYQSTEYVCKFHGRFGDIRQVTGASWSLTLEELTLDTGHSIGEEWIEPNPANGSYRLRYISSAPYGFSKRDGEGMSVPLEPGARFMFYTPEASGKPGGELYGMENESSELFEFWTWWPDRYAISGGSGGTLRCYALRNMETGYGFFGLKAWGIG